VAVRASGPNTARAHPGDGPTLRPRERVKRSPRLRGNVAGRHHDDGIDAASPTTTLLRNVATGNGDLGIVAVPGVTDAGGNRAAGNGNPAQRSGVACLLPTAMQVHCS